MMEKIEEIENIVIEEASSAVPFFQTEAWRIIDKWLEDSEKELTEALINQPSGNEYLRGRIKSYRYLRQLPDVFKKLAETLPPATDSSTSNASPE